jgi:hypothetical protein
MSKHHEEENLDTTPRRTINIAGDHVMRACRDVYSPQQSEVVLWAFYRAKEMTWQQAGEFFDLDTAVLSHVWLGRPKDGELQLFLKSVSEIRDKLGKNPPARFAPTSYSRKVVNALNAARDISDTGESAFVLVAGRARVGKSFTSRGWCEDNNHGLARHWVYPGVGGVKFIVSQICGMNGINRWISYNDQLERMYDCYKPGKGMPSRILVVDQAHKLCEPPTMAMPKLDMFVGMHDVCRVVVVFLATLNKFTQMLASSPYISEQFFGRCRYQDILDDPPLAKDIDALASFYLPRLALTDDLRTLLLRVANKERCGFTKVAEIIKDARRFAEKRGERITAAHVQAVADEQLKDFEKLEKFFASARPGH